MSSLEPIIRLLSAEIGLDVNSIGASSVEWALRQRASARNLRRLEDYAEIVSQDETERQALIELLVVPETWFLRESAAFHLLENHARQHWQPGVQTFPDFPKRLLSLPCSTGEEPYSIAMTLIQAGLPAGSFEIDAVDISARALAHAESALYSANSFRGDDLSYRDRFLSASDSRTYRVHNVLRERVTFLRGNAIDLPFSLSAHAHRYDVIFCRNLLIYMDVPARDKTISNLKVLLKPGGVIFVGHAEIQEMLCRGFNRCSEPRTFACCLTPNPVAGSENEAAAREPAQA